MSATLTQVDPQLSKLIQDETRRQEYGLEMIPSENFVSSAILEVCGSVLTNKYAEGLPHKRYYGGCEVVDQVEELAIERAKQLFGVAYANVQPHSGAQANQAVFEAFLDPGDKVLGMRLDHGGHLTHGSPVNFSGKRYQVFGYGVTEGDELIDYDQMRDLARRERPKLIIAGASAYSRQIDFAAFREVADEVGAVLLADIAHYAGLVAAGVYPSPAGLAHIISTTTHKTLRGPRSGLLMADDIEVIKKLNKAVFPGLQGGPHMHTIAAKALAFHEAATPAFKSYAAQVIANAKALGEELMRRGFRIVSGGTDSHLLLLDLRPKGITGKEAQARLDQIGISTNKNAIPYDPQPPTVCSGVRLGTPAITTRGMRKDEMLLIAELIDSALSSVSEQERLRAAVVEIASRFPLYRDRLLAE